MKTSYFTQEVPMTYVFLSVKIPEDVRKRLKRQAVDENRTAREIVTDLLTKHLKN